MGGALAGSLMAYGESLVILATAGSFLVDFSFLVKAVIIYGLAGMAGGILCSLVLYALVFNKRPLRRTRPGIFFFALLSVSGIILEGILYLLDIDTFRNLSGGWKVSAYFFILMDILAGLAVGWSIWRIGRYLSRKTPRFRLSFGAGIIFGLLIIFWGSRILPGSTESLQPVKPAGNDGRSPLNIIILLVDSLRADHLSAYGYPLPTSPLIDRLAREGVLFRRCYAASNYTIPTHTSIFSGLYPSSHGNYSHYSTLDPAVPTLSQILAGQGYRTGSFYDNRLLGPHFGLSRVFQTSLGVNNEQKTSLTLFRLRERLNRNRSMSENILGVALKWIQYRPVRKRPFFLFINLMDTHMPYRPKRPYIDEFMRSLPDRDRHPETAVKFTMGRVINKKAANDLYPRLTSSDWRWLERIYDSNIRYIDEQVRAFLGRLESAGKLSRTLVIVTADHGEFFGEKGIGQHHQSSLHNAGLHIPLIFWLPGRLAPAEVERPVSQVDIFSTVLSLAGFSPSIPADVQGKDLFSAGESQDVLSEYWDDNRNQFSRAFFSGHFKLVTDPTGRYELYDLENDPGETKDLSLVQPDLLNGLRARLNDKLKSMPQRKIQVDEKKKKQLERLLRSLGYLRP